MAANIARWDGAWHALGQGLDQPPYALLDTNDRLVAGGTFLHADGRTCAYLATWVLPSADFNHDGDNATDSDIEAFFACLAHDCCTTCGSADFNGDGDVGTDADIEAFFRVLAGGPC